MSFCKQDIGKFDVGVLIPGCKDNIEKTKLQNDYDLIFVNFHLFDFVLKQYCNCLYLNEAYCISSKMVIKIMIVLHFYVQLFDSRHQALYVSIIVDKRFNL